MTESPVQGVLKDTLQQIADRILSGTNGDISLVCPRLDNGIYRIEAYAGDFPAELIPISISGRVSWALGAGSRRPVNLD